LRHRLLPEFTPRLVLDPPLLLPQFLQDLQFLLLHRILALQFGLEGVLELTHFGDNALVDFVPEQLLLAQVGEQSQFDVPVLGVGELLALTLLGLLHLPQVLQQRTLEDDGVDVIGDAAEVLVDLGEHFVDLAECVLIAGLQGGGTHQLDRG